MRKIVSLGLAIIIIVIMLPAATLNVSAASVTPMVSLGFQVSAVVKSDATLWMWGEGFGNKPTKIMDDVKFVSAEGDNDIFAVIKTDNSLWTWGRENQYGQLGNGTTKSSSEPIKILDDVKMISINDFYGTAVKNDGTLWAWGYNYHGNVGNNSTDNVLSPVKVMEDVIFSDVGQAGLNGYSSAIKSDNSLYVWGYMAKKFVDKNSQEDSRVPLKLMDNVKYADFEQAIGIIGTDDTLYVAGFWMDSLYDSDKHLDGYNIETPYTPQRYTQNVKKLSTKYSNHSVILKNDNTLYAWGENSSGELGNNTTEYSNKFVKIMEDVIDFDAGYFHCAAIKSDGSLWMWGNNRNGALGNGSSHNQLVPIKIMNLNAGLVIEGENSVQKDKETVLKATRYDENGNIAPEGGITWSCSDESVAQITPWGNNVTVKGLKGGKATITATHAESGQKADFEIEVVSYVMTLAGGYTVMLDEELEINYAVKQGEEYVHNDLDIKWEIESKDSNNAIKIISDKDNAYTRALTVKGINEGECELVAKVDGAELGRTKIEVLGNLADTINDETIIRAKYLINNSQYKYYKNYNSVHGMFADEMDLTPSIVKYSLDNYLSVFYKSIYKGKAPDEVTATEFYECVLVKLLNDDENVKVFGKVGDVMSDYILKYGKKIAEKGTKIDDTNKKQLKEICEGLCGDGLEDVGFIDTLLISGKSIETYFEEYAKIYQMASCTNEQIKAIKLIKNSTSDKALKTACDNVIKSIEKAQTDTAKYAVSSGTTKTAEQLSEYAFEKMVGALEKFSPALAAFDLVKEITSPINNILFQADDIESDTIDLYALIVIENALKDAMSSAEKTFNSNPTAEKAENLMAAADFYKNVQLYGCDICDSLLENYGEAKRNQGIAWDTLVIIMKNVVNREVKMSDVFNALFGNVDSETLDNRKTLSDIRKLIDSADFYGSEGTDVAEFIREVKSTTPSEWAKSEIEKAKNYGFLPDYMQNNYQNNITRAEFCTILTWMIEEKTGKGIGQLIEEKGTPIKSPFEDTYYEYADYMCKLGIVNGVSATEFNPLGEITREQAATMLMRTADVLGYDTSYNTSVESGVASWATEGVGFVTENGIMNGTGNGFEPQGKYTKEQAIATFVRMYDNLK